MVPLIFQLLRRGRNYPKIAPQFSNPVRYKKGLENIITLEKYSNPFDRMLIAQAIIEKLTLITRDKSIVEYDVQTLKA